MVYVLQGENQESIYKHLKKTKSSFNPSNIYEYDGFQKNVELIKDIFYSQNIFGGSYLIIIKVNNIDDLSSLLKMNPFASDHQLILYGTLNKKYNATKDLLKSAQILNFEMESTKYNFLLCEAIFLKRDKKTSIQLINQYKSLEDEIFPLLSLMQTYNRSLISKMYNNSTWKNLSPFFRKKFEKDNKFLEEELIKIYDSLLIVDHSIKSGNGKKIHQLLHDFVIYSI